MRFTEDQFARWATPPSQTERDRMDNAERAVRNAILASNDLKNRKIKVFAQGSYRNRVNVRAESDVDIAVLCYDTFFWHAPDGYTLDTIGATPASYEFDNFRQEVGAALMAHFGRQSVTAGDKAFDVTANTYRVEADVAAFFEHRRYTDQRNYLSGVELRTRSNGARVINWPEQHYENGVSKNNRTSRSYKGCVRILKTLRNAMIADGIASASEASSFLMECLIWNVDDSTLNQTTWTAAMRSAIAELYHSTVEHEKCKEWGEVSELKYLFGGGQKWTRESANQFLYDCWNFVGFE